MAAEQEFQNHILVVDDDPRIRQMLSRYFADEGFRVGTAQGGAAMRAYLDENAVDLVFLDLGLPDEDGFALARDLRTRSRAGVIMITGRGDVVDRIVGLEIGADDYITKPFHLREVLARAKSVLRRVREAAPAPQAAEPADPEDERFGFEGWTLDLMRRELVSPGGEDVPLTTGEFALLCAFVRNAGRVLDRDRLMDLTRGREWHAYDRAIDTQIARLRKKIESDPQSPALIKSVRGVGYVFAAKVQRL
ncbi:response regulator [Propylenella binzhouense]|uniref:Regulatory protein VirG n=1 Tax=Propylenella binzhouense TaxID=2555902 RepID=A0A964T3V5_9HYPH|nr:response regulator [Propylenella binzhouense]MYZ47978.1 response regulator [Propylenella binzhouense]